MKHDAARVRTPLLLLRVKVGLFHLSLLFSECSVGTYSEGLGNEECVECPPNSEATQTGLTECIHVSRTTTELLMRDPVQTAHVSAPHLTNTLPLGLVNLIGRGTFLHHT